MDLIRSFSERFNELIIYAESTPKKMSADLNHNIHDIYHWKSGTARFMPSLKNIIMLADYFNCSIEFLLGIDDENKLPHPKKQLPDFGAHFKKVLKEKGSNLYRLSLLAGCKNTSPYYDWINGKSTPRIDSLYKISKVLDCSIDYLLGRE
ncbi:MAG: helix-turn-helix transcriptional regulator [Clostridia bacterium]|nr:helix-turn-helix transcriptional regulator [Clostridia bacterium]